MGHRSAQLFQLLKENTPLLHCRIIFLNLLGILRTFSPTLTYVQISTLAYLLYSKKVRYPLWTALISLPRWTLVLFFRLLIQNNNNNKRIKHYSLPKGSSGISNRRQQTWAGSFSKSEILFFSKIIWLDLKAIAYLIIYIFLCKEVPVIFNCLLSKSWSDYHGRKKKILLIPPGS